MLWYVSKRETSLSYRASVSAREVMLAMATTAMQSTHVLWTMVAAMTWWVAKELSKAGMTVEVPVLSNRAFAAMTSRELQDFMLCHLTGKLWCYKDGSSNFCEFTQPKLSPRLSCMTYKFSAIMKATGERCLFALLSPMPWKVRIQFLDRCNTAWYVFAV